MVGLMVLGLVFLAVSALFSMIGMGGGILYVPVLLFAGTPVREAPAISLVLIVATSIPALWTFWRSGRVDWKLALVIDPPTDVMAFVGGVASGLVPERVLLGILAAASSAGVAEESFICASRPVPECTRLFVRKTVAAGCDLEVSCFDGPDGRQRPVHPLACQQNLTRRRHVNLIDLAAAQDQLDPEPVPVVGGDLLPREEARLDGFLHGLHFEVAVPRDHGSGELARAPDNRDRAALADCGELEVADRRRVRRVELGLGPNELVDEREADVDKRRDPPGHYSMLPWNGLRLGRRDQPRWLSSCSNLSRHVVSRWSQPQ